MAILISDKINFRSKIFTESKNEHYMMIKVSIYQEDSNNICMKHQDSKICELNINGIEGRAKKKSSTITVRN